MNNYYVDNSVAASGDGSFGSPFKTLSDFFALSSVTHPLTVFLKRGQVHTGGANDTNYLLYNTGANRSYITPYGIGPKPVIAAQDSGSCLVIGRARKLVIDNVVCLGSMVTNSLASISPCAVSGDYKADVWLNDMEFHSVGGRTQVWKPALWLAATNFVLENTGNFGMNNPTFVGTSRGAWVMGLSNTRSTDTDNNGDRYYGYGIRVNNPAFIDVGGDGVIISNAASGENPKGYTKDEFLALEKSTALVNPTFSSNRTDFVTSASVNFWMSNCNKVAFYGSYTDTSIGGQYGADKESVDFDILCHDCLIEGAYSKGAAGFLITSNYASQVTAPPSGTTAFDWYYTKGYGNKNNTIRKSVSFNDAVSNSRGKILLQGYTYNLMIEDCLFIDTSANNVNILLMFGDGSKMYTLTNGVYAAVFTNTQIYAPNAKTLALLHPGSDSGSAALVSATGCNMFASAGVTPTWPAGNMSNNTTVDPGFLNLPTSPPSYEYAMSLLS